MSKQNKKHLAELSSAVEQVNSGQSKLAPIVAKTVIETVKQGGMTDDLLQVIGTIAGQELKAVDVLIAIREQLAEQSKG